jgi:hypothetical protein
VLFEVEIWIFRGTIDARDTTREISETAKELKERGVIKDTATAVEETAAEIGETPRHTSQQVGESTPLTGEVIRSAAIGVKTRTKRGT